MRMPPSLIGITRSTVERSSPGDPAQQLVLVVEDHDVMRETLVDILTLIGVDSITVDRGEYVLALMREHHPNLVLLDVELPGEMSGLDALHAMRNTPALAETPVILVTLEHNLANSAEVGAADEVMLKPVDVDHLIRLVQGLLKLPATRV